MMTLKGGGKGEKRSDNNATNNSNVWGLGARNYLLLGSSGVQRVERMTGEENQERQERQGELSVVTGGVDGGGEQSLFCQVDSRLSSPSLGFPVLYLTSVRNYCCKWMPGSHLSGSSGSSFSGLGVLGSRSFEPW